MTTAPDTVNITCPVCGAVEEAKGVGNMEVMLQQSGIETRLNYSASVIHNCPEINNPLRP